MIHARLTNELRPLSADFQSVFSLAVVIAVIWSYAGMTKIWKETFSDGFAEGTSGHWQPASW